MKKAFAFLLIFMLILAASPSALAAGDGPRITLQPQNYVYPEYSTAMYTVKAEGDNLHASWFMEFEGKTYEISKTGGAIGPWEGYAGENYGAHADGGTFTYFFGGIENGLDGALLWCVIEDGHYDVKSDSVIINIGGTVSPPEILAMPTGATVAKGAEYDIMCTAKSTDGTQLSFIWYETTTGKIQDLVAILDESEYSNFHTCDTSSVGTRYYACAVKSEKGGLAYSSIVPVTVTEAKQTVISPDVLPEAVAGKPYEVKLTAGKGAGFSIVYNPGHGNDFDKTGLSISADGVISGTPKDTGTYEFCVCAAGEGEDVYQVYNLIVKAQDEGTDEPPADGDGKNGEDDGGEKADDGKAEDGEKADGEKTDGGKAVVTNEENNGESAKIDPLWFIFGGVAAALVAVIIVLCVMYAKLKKKTGGN